MPQHMAAAGTYFQLQFGLVVRTLAAQTNQYHSSRHDNNCSNTRTAVLYWCTGPFQGFYACQC